MTGNPSRWQERIVPPDKALEKIEPGMTIFLGTGAAEPRTLVKHLMASEAGNLQDLTLIQVVSLGGAISLKELRSQKYRLKTFYSGWVAAEAIAEGKVDLIPSRFSNIPRLLTSRRIPVDAAFIQVTAPNEAGYCSLGIAVDVARQVMEHASLIVGEINDLVPHTYGDTFIPVQDFHLLVRATEPPLLFERQPVEDVFQRVATNVASVIEDGRAPEAFRLAFGERPPGPIRLAPLAGDGSDRRWYRIEARGRRLVLADHGIRTSTEATAEVDATVAIGRHLERKGVPVPRIHLDDRFSGLVFLQDLGDTHLESFVRRARDPGEVAGAYATLIGLLARLSRKGAEGFDPAWTWQSAAYDRDVTIEKECRYFLRAFVQGYAGRKADAEALETDFRHLAEGIAADGVIGFMHRDLQSRNVMMHEGRLYFIDYQGGRTGPIQYDLASLLIDPYVGLPGALQDRLLELCAREVGRFRRVDAAGFRRCYDYCAISRNLQILGAFAFLSREKRKTRFEAYIPSALRTLRLKLARLADPGLAGLKSLVDGLRLPDNGPAGNRAQPEEDTQ